MALKVTISVSDDRLYVYTVTMRTVSGFAEKAGRKGEGQMPTVNFWLSKNCQKIFFLSENFRPRIQNLGPTTPIVEKISEQN